MTLARKLLKLGGESADDPTVAYVLFRMAEERSAAAGSLPVAVEAIDGMDAGWVIDAWSRKSAAAERTVDSLWQARGAAGGPSAESVMAAALQLAETAVEADQYAMAGEVLEMLIAAARRARNGNLVRKLVERKKTLSQREKNFAAYQTACQMLASFPGNADAKLTAGRWLGLVKGRWDEGLPLLARCSDPMWSSLAQRDLAATTEPTKQLALADTWWQQAQKESGRDRSTVARKAVHWYDRAMENLAPLQKIQTNGRRLEALSTVGDPNASSVAGAVEEGNVALASNGTKLSGEKITDPEHLLHGTKSTTYSNCPCQWTITFGRTYRLQEIRLELYSPNTLSYHYAIATSADGKAYLPVTERTSDSTRPFEQILFPARSVKSIKLIGIASTHHNTLEVREFEA